MSAARRTSATDGRDSSPRARARAAESLPKSKFGGRARFGRRGTGTEYAFVRTNTSSSAATTRRIDDASSSACRGARGACRRARDRAGGLAGRRRRQESEERRRRRRRLRPDERVDRQPDRRLRPGRRRALDSRRHLPHRRKRRRRAARDRSEEHTSELQSHSDLVCRLLLEKKKKIIINYPSLHKKELKKYDEQ